MTERRFLDLSAASSTRTLACCAAGALIGLAIAGYGLFTASGTTTFLFPPEDAALVNQVPILMVDYIGQLRALYDVALDGATPQQKSQVLHDMIREELYVQRGIELGLPSDDIDVRTALVGATEAQTASDAMSEVPDDQELRGFYDAHRDKYATEGVMTLDDWLVPAGRSAEASAIASGMRRGSRPDSFGLVRSARLDEPEQYYFAAKIHLGPALFAAAAQMRSGEVSDPVAADDGVHILVMRAHAPPVRSAFEQVRAQVLLDFMAEKRQQLLAANTAFLFKRAHVTVAPELR